MQVIKDIDKTRSTCQNWRDQGESIAFVPTMGCLHQGHLSLVEKAQNLADHVVVSIFVNPLQFNDADDLTAYPRTLDEDITGLSTMNVDLVFTPASNAFYPEGESKVEKIDLGELASILEGEHRPGHFAGVATVVKRLFDQVQPDVAVFGEKDFQQLMLINRLVEQFSMGIEIIGMPTFRETDGLAMSSRNTRLNSQQRKQAVEIYRQLSWIKSSVTGGRVDYPRLEQQASQALSEAGFRPEYVAIRDATTLLQPDKQTRELVALVAAKLGDIRLIDNIRL